MEYKVTDINLAAFLNANGYELLRYEVEPENAIYFDNVDEEIIISFNEGNLTTSEPTILDAIKKLIEDCKNL